MAYNYVVSKRTFEQHNNETVINIEVETSNFNGELFNGDFEAASKIEHVTYVFRWQPPTLIKEEQKPDLSQREVAEFPDPLTEDLAVAGLLTKWFPVTDSDGKLKRIQLCGAEGFIEIISNDQHIWREQGYQDVWEAAVENLTTRSGEDGGGYLVTLKLTDGSKKEINFVRNQDVEFVFMIDGKMYTSQPDKFEISNNTEDCGD